MADSPLADSLVPGLILRPYFILAARFMFRLNLLRSTPPGSAIRCNLAQIAPLRVRIWKIAILSTNSGTPPNNAAAPPGGSSPRMAPNSPARDRWSRLRASAAARTGPYFLLVVRDAAGRRHSVYLGVASPLVEEVRGQLARQQAPLRQRRIVRGVQRQLRRELHQAWQELDRNLSATCLRRKGCEIRGWRTCQKIGSALPAPLISIHQPRPDHDRIRRVELRGAAAVENFPAEDVADFQVAAQRATRRTFPRRA